MLLEHEPITFPNYPYEWAPEMLQAAGELTLDMASTALSAAWGLKDATPYNVMFEGSRPVFLDALSFDERDPLDPVWRPYAQFMRTFVFPLLATRHSASSLADFLITRRDGLEPDEVLRSWPAWKRYLPPFAGAVTIPAMLSKRGDKSSGSAYRERRARTPDEAKFVLSRTIGRAKRLLASARRRENGSRWSSYMQTGLNYSAPEFAAKEAAVRATLERLRPATVLDVGCNTGHFSMLAASLGARVVALDNDASVVGSVWRRARDSKQPVLPLVVNIARPPGAVGWANSECASFLDRAAGRFACVLMLAVAHHLIVNERVPLALLFDFAARLTSGCLIIEYVDPADEQFRTLARGREALHADLNAASFEAAAREHFDVLDNTELTHTRRLYILRKRS